MYYILWSHNIYLVYHSQLNVLLNLEFFNIYPYIFPLQVLFIYYTYILYSIENYIQIDYIVITKLFSGSWLIHYILLFLINWTTISFMFVIYILNIECTISCKFKI